MTRKLAAALLCLLAGLALAWALADRPEPQVDLPRQVAVALPASGVDHAVTAVLLDWRSFDTLLEVMVLLVAVMVALALREAQPDSPDRMGLENPLLRGVMSWLLPLMLLVAGYLLWAGAHRPGGAFQAGAVLAAAGVLLRLAGVSLPGFKRSWLLRTGLVVGGGVFLTAGTLMLFTGRPFLAWPASAAGALILLVEITLAISIGLGLLGLFRLTPPYPDDPGVRKAEAEEGR